MSVWFNGTLLAKVMNVTSPAHNIPRLANVLYNISHAQNYWDPLPAHPQSVPIFPNDYEFYPYNFLL